MPTVIQQEFPAIIAANPYFDLLPSMYIAAKVKTIAIQSMPKYCSRREISKIHSYEFIVAPRS
jgi:hypothetical protein